METPIADFVKEYAKNNKSRFHMPGHKGQAFLGCELLDLTEVAGADALYEAEGIIAESEKNASRIFGSAKTLYSTEGSSQCIRAMMHLLLGYWKLNHAHFAEKREEAENGGKADSRESGEKRPYILAARNGHKALLYAAALVDFDIVWLYPEEMHSLCSCQISVKQLEEELTKQIQKHQGRKPAAVYVTSPDYLGGTLDISALAESCHKYQVLLAVDNAHGSYLHFLDQSMHPLDLGADICCDSAHKTLPVLTGGAYLHIGKQAPEYIKENAKQSMALFGSTSPSYLTLSSLDLCNAYLQNGYKEKLSATIEKIENLKTKLEKKGWEILPSDPLKLTLVTTGICVGSKLADVLRGEGIECEYADEEFVVFMMTPENKEEDFMRLFSCLNQVEKKSFRTEYKLQLVEMQCEPKVTIREAVFAPQEMVEVENSLGRICGTPTVGCPPAIPIVVAGERISKEAVKAFQYYGIERVAVMKE